MESKKLSVIGKTGKPKELDLFDIEFDPHVIQNPVNGKYEVFVSRWYKLPKYYTSLQEAAKDALDVEKYYYL